MAVTAFTVFNRALTKLLNGTLDLDTQQIKVVLCGSAQSIGADFAGTSTDCRYADLTAELATANGYTQKDKVLGSVTLNRSSGVVTFDAADVSWTLTGAITYKYIVLVMEGAPNDDLLGFVDVDDSSGSATTNPPAGTHTITWNASGIFTFQRAA